MFARNTIKDIPTNTSDTSVMNPGLESVVVQIVRAPSATAVMSERAVVIGAWSLLAAAVVVVALCVFPAPVDVVVVADGGSAVGVGVAAGVDVAAGVAIDIAAGAVLPQVLSWG